MTDNDWAAIEELGPPPNDGDYWFAAATWECRRGHLEFAALTLSPQHAVCYICDWPLTKLKGAWVKGEQSSTPDNQGSHNR